jgi:hypothetical protein
MFDTLVSVSAPLPAAPVIRRAAWARAPLPSLRPLSGRTFLLFAFAYLYSFPYLDRLRHADEMPRALVAQEIAERRSFRLDGRQAELPAGASTVRSASGQLHAGAAPAPAFLAAPLHAAAKLMKVASPRVSTWAFRALVVTLPALLFLPLFYRLTARFTPEEPARRAALVAYAFGSAALPLSSLFLSDQLAAVCLGGAFLAAVTLVRGESGRPNLTALLVGMLCAAALLIDYRALFVSPVIALYVLACASSRVKIFFLFVLGAAPFLIGLGAWQKLVLGSPFRLPLPDAGGNFDPTAAAAIGAPSGQVLFDLFLSPASGLFVLMPWALLALVGAGMIFGNRAARRLVGQEAVVCLLAVLAYAAALACLPAAAAGERARPGLGLCLPFIAWLAASGFAAAYRRFASRSLAQALILVSVVVYVAAASTFPYWPAGLDNPLYELTFRLVDGGYSPHSAGTALGLKGVWALAPLYLYAAGVTFWLLAFGVRRAFATLPLACLAGAGLLLLYQIVQPPALASDAIFDRITEVWEPPPAQAPDE